MSMSPNNHHTQNIKKKKQQLKRNANICRINTCVNEKKIRESFVNLNADALFAQSFINQIKKII